MFQKLIFSFIVLVTISSAQGSQSGALKITLDDHIKRAKDVIAEKKDFRDRVNTIKLLNDLIFKTIITNEKIQKNESDEDTLAEFQTGLKMIIGRTAEVLKIEDRHELITAENNQVQQICQEMKQELESNYKSFMNLREEKKPWPYLQTKTLIEKVCQ